jgi:Domain of unknown function (DUF4126)
MSSLTELAQALGIAYAAGINLYATVAILGLAERSGWITSLPGPLHGIDSLWIISLASILYVVEFLATLVPGLASLWESVHTVIRPPAAALLAAGTLWGGDPKVMLAAALLGGGLALATHGTKLGLRVAVDTSPEPVTNGVVNVAELGVVTALIALVGRHPVLALVMALVLLVTLLLLVRAVWRGLRSLFSRPREPIRRDA